MSAGFWQIAIVALLVLILFGRGKISDLMGDVAKGIRSFKKGLSEDDIDVSHPTEAKGIDQKSETIIHSKNSKKTNS
ncbi:MAG: twin-arginine translocase TatA/TatE family subunit [Alphaproteobacteria bacterium]|nr:twin-arginine translocase TatA/TatE family subunit [Alphaproteobacteria bacterium]